MSSGGLRVERSGQDHEDRIARDWSWEYAGAMSREGPAEGRTDMMAKDGPDEERRAVSDLTAEANDDDRNEPDRPESEAARPLSYARPAAAARRGGGLRFYKPGQGYYTRVWTAVGGAVLILWGAMALYQQLSSLINPKAPYYLGVSYGVATAFVVGLGAFLYWLVGLSRRTNDFFIATEGEMKKVSWSSRKDVIRSTKVVISGMLMFGALLFVADLAFMWFFHLLGVLQAFPSFASLFGLKS